MASSDSPASETVVSESGSVDVKLLLSQGQKSVKVGDVSAAIEGLKEACTVLEKQFGEGAIEVADAYLLYGQALLLKSTADCSAVPVTKDSTAAAAPGGDALAAGDSVTEEAKESPVGTSTVAEVGDKASGDSDSALSLQVVEKILGYASDAFSRSDEREAKIKHGDALLGLGKSCLQRKNYDQGASYLEKSLDVQKSLTLGDTKALVDTYYSLSVCHSALKRPGDSLTELNLSMAAASSILATEATVNGTEGEAVTEKHEDLAAVKVLLQNIMSMIERVRAESGITADAGTTASQTAAQPEPAREHIKAVEPEPTRDQIEAAEPEPVLHQIKAAEPEPVLDQIEAAEPAAQATELGNSGSMEGVECPAAAPKVDVHTAAPEAAIPSVQNLEPAAESACPAEKGNADGVVTSDDITDSDAAIAAASVIPANDAVAPDISTDITDSNVPAAGAAASVVPANDAAAPDTAVQDVDATDAPVENVAVSVEPAEGLAASDGSTVVSNITNVLWNKRPLEEENQEVVKRAKHDVEVSENGENNVDVSAVINNADGCHGDA